MVQFMSKENGNILTYKEMLAEWNELYDGGDDTNPVGWDEYYTPIHECKYCGAITNGADVNVLCEDCRMTFGHTFYSEL